MSTFDCQKSKKDSNPNNRTFVCTSFHFTVLLVEKFSDQQNWCCRRCSEKAPDSISISIATRIDKAHVIGAVTSRTVPSTTVVLADSVFPLLRLSFIHLNQSMKYFDTIHTSIF